MKAIVFLYFSTQKRHIIRLQYFFHITIQLCARSYNAHWFRLKSFRSENKERQTCSNGLKFSNFHVFCSWFIQKQHLQSHRNIYTDKHCESSNTSESHDFCKNAKFLLIKLVINFHLDPKSRTQLQFISHFPNPLCSKLNSDAYISLFQPV